MLKKTFTGLLLLSGLWAGSCKDSDEEVQIDVKNIQVSGLEEGAEVWNTAELSVTTENQEGIQQIDFYIGDESIASDKTAPYEFTWNTREYEDGEYTVKMVVVTTGGKTVEKSLTVQVKNTLLKLTIGDDFLYYNDKENYIVLSDTTGNVLHYQKVQNGQSYNIPSPGDFNDGIYDFTIIGPDDGYSEPRWDFDTYLSLPRGFQMSFNNDRTEPLQVPVSIKNVDPEVESYHIITNHISNFFDGTNGNYTYSIDNPESDFYVWIQNKEGKYFSHLYKGIKSGQENTIDLSLINTELDVIEGSFSAEKKLWYSIVYGWVGNDNYELFNYDINTEMNTYSYIHPGNWFDQLKLRYHFVYGDILVSHENSPGIEPSFPILEGAKVTGNAKSLYEFDITVEGEMDRYELFLKNYQNTYDWYCVGPKERNHVNSINYPDEIQSKISQDKEINQFKVSLVDFPDFEGYLNVLQADFSDVSYKEERIEMKYTIIQK
ncbi:Ig-like domain-containing protein [Rapidithrix thailandica]|uniref:Ig-like domain-containing protein n=1 Tax=Rapidithrix thailandica TaxID=413964 RepID=A0AAW9S3W3_9BACT